MTKTNFITAVFIAALAGSVQAATTSGSQLKSNCNNGAETAGEGCMGFVAGIHDVAQAMDLITAPAGVTTEQMVDIVAKYLNDHPERLQYPAHMLVFDALDEAFQGGAPKQ